MRVKAAEEECRHAVALDGQNALAHYELVKVWVARGDCTSAKAETAKLGTLGAAKGKAQAQAEEILKTCVAGKVVKPAADGKGGKSTGK
jgi:hypothetical protein